MSGTDVDRIIARIKAGSARLRATTVRAIRLAVIFETFNDPTNPLRAQGIPHNVGADTCNVLMDAGIRELVLVIVRAFDPPGGPLLKTDRVSFPIVLGLLKQPGVFERLTDRSWPFKADGSPNPYLAAFTKLEEDLDRLEKEQPNRRRLLRSFRDEFLAHDLELEGDRPKPAYAYFPAMVKEMMSLCCSLARLAEGTLIDWDFYDDDVRQSALALWDLMAAGTKSEGGFAQNQHP